MKPPFGAILAGGRSSRYGAPKALATVGGRRIIDRVRDALSAAVSDQILIANEDAFADLGLPTRPDTVRDAGALGGIHAALLWAREEERAGVLAVACDMPFLAGALLRRILEVRVHDEKAFDIVAPESGGRRGVEPLCAYYATRCIAAIESQLERGERHVIGFWNDVEVHRLSEQEVRSYGDPQLLFMNVNTPEERELAESLSGGSRA